MRSHFFHLVSNDIHDLEVIKTISSKYLYCNHMAPQPYKHYHFVFYTETLLDVDYVKSLFIRVVSVDFFKKFQLAIILKSDVSRLLNYLEKQSGRLNYVNSSRLFFESR